MQHIGAAAACRFRHSVSALSTRRLGWRIDRHAPQAKGGGTATRSGSRRPCQPSPGICMKPSPELSSVAIGTPHLAPPPVAVPHTLAEDAYGLVSGVLFAAVGIAMLKAAGLVTGGIAGIALLTSYVVP